MDIDCDVSTYKHIFFLKIIFFKNQLEQTLNILTHYRPDAGKIYSAEKIQKVWWFYYVSMEPRVNISHCSLLPGHIMYRKPVGHKIVCTEVKFKVASMLSKSIPTDSSCYNNSKKV